MNIIENDTYKFSYATSPNRSKIWGLTGMSCEKGMGSTKALFLLVKLYELLVSRSKNNLFYRVLRFAVRHNLLWPLYEVLFQFRY